MADCVSLSGLNSLCVNRSSTLCRQMNSVSVSVVSCSTHFEASHCASRALTSSLGDSNPLLRGISSHYRGQFDIRGGEAATRIACSSRDPPDANEEDEHEYDKLRWRPRDGYGLYPWDRAWEALDPDDVHWIQEETITLFTSEGMVKLGGSRMLSPRAFSNGRKYGHLRALSRLRRYREEDYMDPKQGLCLGAIFDIAATNGLDMGRRFCVLGFCRSIEMLSDVVEDTVLEQGGEVVVAEKQSLTGLNEKLTMTVAMPALWGVPPAFDVLNSAIRSGGGIVEKTYKKWEFF